MQEPEDAASFVLQGTTIRGNGHPNRKRTKSSKFAIWLDDGKTRTLEEVGKEFKVTRERIRQIEAKSS